MPKILRAKNKDFSWTKLTGRYFKTANKRKLGGEYKRARTSKIALKKLKHFSKKKVDEEAVALLAELREQKVPAKLDVSRIWTSYAEAYLLEINIIILL